MSNRVEDPLFYSYTSPEQLDAIEAGLKLLLKLIGSLPAGEKDKAGRIHNAARKALKEIERG